MLRRSPNATLKEKLKDHYHQRDFVPRVTSASKVGLISTACLIFILFLEALVILLPGLYAAQTEDGQVEARYGWLGEGYWLALLVVVLSWMEVTWNWWRVYYDVPNWVTKEMKVSQFGQLLETPAGWKHCPTCQLDAPPRSHHCLHCGHCILKRDHHCFFTGACVGLFNQRHFVVFCLYVIWGCALGLYLQLSYLHQTVYPLPGDYMMYVAPVPILQFLTGNLSLLHFFLMVHVYVNVFFLSTAAAFLGWQLIIIPRGQTSFEAFRKIRIYNAGSFYANWVNVFGSPLTSWILLFAPLMLPLEGEAARWTVKPKAQKGN